MADERARAATAGDQPFLLKLAQRLANGETADLIMGAEFLLGREICARSEFLAGDARAQVRCNLEVERLACQLGYVSRFG